MLPLHCLRSGNLLQCTSMLISSSFLHVRKEILGIKDTSQQYHLDCIEMHFRMKSSRKINPNLLLIKFTQIMKNVLENGKNDNDQDYIGKPLHGLASLLDNLKMFDKAMEFYQHALEHKKDAPEFN